MTNEEAIKTLNKLLVEYNKHSALSPDLTNREVKAINLAIQALEKQTQKKPIEKHYEEKGERPYIKFKCPSSCGSEYQVLPHTDKYCLNCGQALDWSDEE